MSKLQRAARRAVATFLFSTIGTVAGNSIFNIDAATWKLAAATGIGAVLNLIYRWAEAAMKDPEPTDDPGGDVK